MYKRKDTIEEEHLEWESKPIIPAVFKHDKTSSYKKTTPEKKLSITRKDTELLIMDSKLFLLFSILIFPYILGFLISYLLYYFFGGMTIKTFLDMQQLHLQIEFWSIGAYLLVIAGVIWFVFKFLVLLLKAK